MLPEAPNIPSCDLCSIKYGNMQELALHMKNIHDETDSRRITRLENWLSNPVSNQSTTTLPSNVKIYDCTKCGTIFKMKEDFASHDCEYNNINKVNVKCMICEKNFTSSEDMNEHMLNVHPSVVHDIIVINHLEEGKNYQKDPRIPAVKIDMEYEVKVQPKEAEKEKKQSIKFYSNSKEFSEGLEKMKGLITKGSTYNVDGCEIRVVEDLLVGKSATIEVGTEELNGTVGIKFCSSKKNGTAVVVNKKSKQDFALVSA